MVGAVGSIMSVGRTSSIQVFQSEIHPPTNAAKHAQIRVEHDFGNVGASANISAINDRAISDGARGMFLDIYI